jgi:hypothetical protein
MTRSSLVWEEGVTGTAGIGDPSSPPQEGIFWGLGWGLQGPGGREAIWHWGDNGAWRAYVAARRDGSAGLVYFANSHKGLGIARDLAALAMGGTQPGLDWLGYDGR